MATQSFKNLAEAKIEDTTAAPAEVVAAAPAEVVAAAPAEVVAAAPKQELAAPSQAGPAGIEGEIDHSDIKLPRINVVQKMSDLVNAGFRAGDLVYNREVLLPRPVNAVVVRVKKQYQQDLPYGGDQMPHVCDTLQEVREAGGTIEWGGENHYSELAHMQLLIQAPVDLAPEHEDLFPYEVAGVRWAPAMFTAAKTAYKSAAKPVITAAFNTLRNGLGHGLWAFSTEEKKNAMGSWSVPVMRLAGKNPPEIVEFVESLNR